MLYAFQEDNTFTVRGLQPGSYLVEVINADFYYEPVRVDITSKGKIRARKVNNVQPTQVSQVNIVVESYFIHAFNEHQCLILCI